MTLDELALKHGTDKASDLHNYTRWYSALLPTQESEINLLEIGVSDGGSILMWVDYYPNANIIGIDIKDCWPVLGAKIFLGDQKDPVLIEDIASYYTGFDIVIDDGSHKWKDQIESFKLLWPHIRPGGVYVIEDLHTSYFMEFGEPGALNTMAFLHLIMDEVNMYGAGGLGDCRNLQCYDEIKHSLSIYQRTVESMIFYPSICFIRKTI